MFKLPRFELGARRPFAVVFAAVALAATLPATAADPYPTKPVRVLVNSSPGGLTDVIARLVMSRMSQNLGQQFLVENRAGAAGQVGADALAKSTPDGYTIGVVGNALSAFPALNPKLPFKPETDLTPVALLITSPMVFVTNPNSGYHTVADYVNAAKAKPGALVFASGGNVTMGHLLAEQLQATAGISLIHVPYKGGAPAMADLLAGHVPVFFDPIGTTTPLARDGKIRPLAIVADKRAPALPDVPTIAEAGFPDVKGMSWFAIFAPAGTPPAIIAKLNAEANKALQAPEVKERLVAIGATGEGGPPKVLGDLLHSEIPRWTKLIRERNIKAD